MNDIEPLRSAIVRKSNFLIQKAQYSLDLKSQKVILFLISKIEPFASEFHPIKFSISEFYAVCGIENDSGKNYSDVKKTLLKLASPFEFVNIGNKRVKAVSWIEKPTLDIGSGTVEVMFDENVKPYLLNLRMNYTAFELRFILCMRSGYAVRIYEIIKSLHFSKIPHDSYEYEYGLPELKTLLGATNHKTYQHFQSCVLVPAEREINEYTDKTLSYEPIRRGRSVIAIKLRIKNKDSSETLHVRAKIDKILGPEQFSLWDQMIQS